MRSCNQTYPQHSYARGFINETDIENIYRVSKAVRWYFLSRILFVGFLAAIPLLCLIPAVSFIESFYGKLMMISLIAMPFPVLALLNSFDLLRTRADKEYCNIVYGSILSERTELSHQGRGGFNMHHYAEFLVDGRDIIESGELVDGVSIADRSGRSGDGSKRAAMVWLNESTVYIVSAVQGGAV